MGYERHILRNSKHGDDSSITLEEWMTYVATDPSLKTSGDDPMIFNWTEHPVGTIEGDLPWLHYRDGRISTRHPDEYLSLKMFEIAEKLNAQLEMMKEYLMKPTDRSLKVM
ncbi:MAG: hypothetical protein IPN38_19070 [Flavobacteriales bacterium]|nr:hypothetical protein [Flavobacteriales bacterium]